jgi:hypothetical protein
VKKTKRLVVTISLFMTVLGCGTLKDVPLVWSPTNDTYGKSTGSHTLYPAHQFKVVPFTDNRVNKFEIARNVESSNPKIVTTKDNVSSWCTNRFKEILQLQGFNLTDTGETVQLRGEVIQYNVIESMLYRGVVALKITVESPDNKILWQGLVTGSAKRFGSSHSLINYYETLSDSYLDAVQNLIKDDSFVKALQAKK